jgi:hypothetical protein
MAEEEATARATVGATAGKNIASKLRPTDLKTTARTSEELVDATGRATAGDAKGRATAGDATGRATAGDATGRATAGDGIGQKKEQELGKGDDVEYRDAGGKWLPAKVRRSILFCCSLVYSCMHAFITLRISISICIYIFLHTGGARRQWRYAVRIHTHTYMHTYIHTYRWCS